MTTIVATATSISVTRMPNRSSTPTRSATQAPTPGTAWASGPARLRIATNGATPSANCWPP